MKCHKPLHDKYPFKMLKQKVTLSLQLTHTKRGQYERTSNTL